MPRFSDSTEIERPPEVVWRAIGTLERWLEGYLETRSRSADHPGLALATTTSTAPEGRTGWMRGSRTPSPGTCVTAMRLLRDVAAGGCRREP
jgi:hypothetical protein